MLINYMENSQRDFLETIIYIINVVLVEKNVYVLVITFLQKVYGEKCCDFEVKLNIVILVFWKWVQKGKITSKIHDK